VVSSTPNKEIKRRGEVKTQGRLVRFKTGISAGLFEVLEVSMTRVPEKSAMGLPSKQRNGFKVHSLSKEQASGSWRNSGNQPYQESHYRGSLASLGPPMRQRF
jgi:hypothetical protein